MYWITKIVSKAGDNSKHINHTYNTTLQNSHSIFFSLTNPDEVMKNNQ